MKKTWFVLLLLTVLLLCGTAWAEEAKDITKYCTLTTNGNENNIWRMLDHESIYYWNSRKGNGGYLDFTVPEGQTFGGLYITWGEEVAPWALQKKNGKAFDTLYQGKAGDYAHQYIPGDGGNGVYRIQLLEIAKYEQLHIRDLYILSDGDLPGWVQLWEPTKPSCDLMVISAHADDELIFFGGVIPYYNTERGLDVVVAYMSVSDYYRRTELLNGLWECGVRNYPVIGPFRDEYCETLSDGYAHWGGKAKVTDYILGLMDIYQPKVVITHDTNGEYGHGAHKATAAGTLATVTEHNTSVEKLYLHLYKENSLTMDWRQPLSALGGRTALQVAKDAFQLHVSQRDFFSVKDTGATANNLFGLAYTTVGADEEKNDLMEHISLDKE